MHVFWTIGSRLCSFLYQHSRPQTTVKDELKQIGYLGTKEVSNKASPLSAHFEIVGSYPIRRSMPDIRQHIEQGSRLKKSGKDVGVVDSIQGMRWYDVSLRGVTRHTDTIYMDVSFVEF